MFRQTCLHRPKTISIFLNILTSKLINPISIYKTDLSFIDSRPGRIKNAVPQKHNPARALLVSTKILDKNKKRLSRKGIWQGEKKKNYAKLKMRMNSKYVY